MPGGVFATPRPIPGRAIPMLGGAAVIALALPVFLIAGWPVTAWGLAAALWVVYEAIGLLLERLPLGMDSFASTGVVGIGRMLRTVLLMTILIVVTTSDAAFGLQAAGVFALAFTVEFALSMISYLGGEARG